jgi:putative ABC transport system permease protein
MLRNYLVTALRNIKRHKSHSIINLAGMAVGLSATILIYTFVSHELGYDKFHENHDRVYRLVSLVEMAGDHSIKAPVTQGALPPLLTDAIPGITATTRIHNATAEINFEDQRFFNNRRLIVDDSFLEIFTFPVIEGNRQDPLKEPGAVVITRDLAEKIFGERQATGRTISIADRDYTVTAITENIPANSHLHFDLLISFKSLENEDEFIKYQGFGFYSYFMIEKDARHGEVLETTDRFINEFYEKQLQGMGIKVTSFYQLIGKIHLFSEDMQFEMSQGGKISNVYIFSLLAFFILLIAIVNHVNLVTARADTRSREIALRKIAGSTRYHLVIQFISESFMVTVISLAIAISLAELLLNPFGNLLNRELVVHYFSAEPVLFLIILTLVTGIGSGVYPALHLSGLSPVKIFQKQSGSRPGGLLKVFLVVFQFSIAIFLITSLIIIYSQTNYMRGANPGFNRENILVINNLTREITDNYKSVKEELLRFPGITSVTASEGIPGNQATVQNSWAVEGGSRDNAIMMYENRVQDDYFETYQIPIIEGRFFSGDMETDKSAFVINQSAARALGLDDPLGKDINVWETRGTIIGVVNDFHFESLHEPVKPIAHSRYSDHFRFISVRIATGDIGQTIEVAGKVLNGFDPDYVYTHNFLDARLDKIYEAEERNARLISMSAILSIIISVMGLYSLTSFTITRKTKEIGIRKTLGSTTRSLLLLLYKDMGQWVLLSNLIAWPAAWYIMNRWLENFAYRIEPGLWMFVASGAIALLVAMLTITGLAIRAAGTNPVNALRYE